MKKAEKDALIEAIDDRLFGSNRRFTPGQGYASVSDRKTAANDIFRVISRISHSQVPGDQRKTKKSRAEIDAQIAANVKSALRVL
mgnify:CR=1 FL=1